MPDKTIMNVLKEICAFYGYMDYYVKDENLILDDYQLDYKEIKHVQIDVEYYFKMEFEKFHRFTKLMDLVNIIKDRNER